MADDEKDKSTNEIIQALDALSQLSQARATRRATSLPLPRTGSAKGGDDAGAVVDAAVKEALPRPRLRRRSSLTSSPSSWSKPKSHKNEKDEEEEMGDDADLIIIIKSQGLAADEARPQPRRRISLMLPPFQSRSKLEEKEEDDEEEEDDDWTHSALLKSQGFAAAALEADGEKKRIMSWGPTTQARSHIGMRPIGCLFSMEVVAALGLPQSMNGLRLAVTVRNKETRDGAVQQTKPARVQLGVAYFDEALYVRCHLYGTGEPRPFILSLVAVDAPELDFGRSTVDLSLFAKEFTDKCVRQWDMVFPLAGKAKGGELVVKLAFQSIDSQAAGEDKASAKMLTPKIRRSSEGQKVGDRTRRKLRRSSVSNTLAPNKMTPTEAPKIGVPARDLRDIDSFKIDDEPEPKPELTSIDEVKETRQTEPEHEPTDEPTSATEVRQDEEQQKEPESEPADETTPVNEEEKQAEPERESDEPTSVAEVKQDEEQQKEPQSEPADEPIPVAEVKEEEQQKEQESEPAHEPTPAVAELKEEEQQADEPTPVAEVKQEEEQQKEQESEPADGHIPVAEVKEEKQQKEQDREPADEPTLAVAEVEDDERQKEQERDQADDLTPVAEVNEEEEEMKEPERDQAGDHTPVAEVEEEQQKEALEHEPEDAQEDDDSKLPEFDDVIDKGDDGQQVKAELLKEEAEAKKGSEEEASLVAGDEGAKVVVATGLEEKSLEATLMPRDVSSDAVADAVEPVDAKEARLEEVTGESLQVPEQGEDKGAATKPPRRRFKWRTVALLVPISVFVSNTLGLQR